MAGVSEGEIFTVKIKAGFILFSLAFSIGCLVTGSKLARRSDSTACIPFLQWSFISMGLVFFFAFILFVVIGCCYCCAEKDGFDKALGWHLGVKCLGLLVFLCLLIFALTAIKIKFTGFPMPEAYKFDIDSIGVDPTEVYSVREYNLSDYRGSLKRRMADARYWATITKCLRRRHACDGMSPMVHAPNTSLLYSEQGLSPIQSGCCKPPLSCAFTYVNQTMWTPPTQGAPSNNTDEDCGRWSNQQQTLCFQCDSCKAAVLADIQRAWSKPVVVVLSVVIFQIVILPCVAVWLCNKEI